MNPYNSRHNLQVMADRIDALAPLLIQLEKALSRLMTALGTRPGVPAVTASAPLRRSVPADGSARPQRTIAATSSQEDMLHRVETAGIEGYAGRSAVQLKLAAKTTIYAGRTTEADFRKCGLIGHQIAHIVGD